MILKCLWRILGDKGHLSNEDAAYYLSEFVGNKTKTIILGHLSDDNNTCDLALETIKKVSKLRNKNILVAKQKKCTGWIEVWLK